MNVGISPKDLLTLIIRPTLKKMGMHSESACILLLCTAAQESGLGHYLKQIKGPALGPYQTEPATHRDIYINFLSYRPVLFQKIGEFSRFRDFRKRDLELVTNLEYSTAIARLVYYRVSAPLPKKDDIRLMAYYWKKYYNTYQGHGTMTQFIRSYEGLIKGKI